jgi:hypothetical protein
VSNRPGHNQSRGKCGGETKSLECVHEDYGRWFVG